jgi:hypothetical protein
MAKSTHTKKVLLEGEGVHHHALVGKFEMDNDTIVKDFAPIKVKEDSVLRHEKPNGDFSQEHRGLQITRGGYVMGQQVEYNPFSQSVSRVWD